MGRRELLLSIVVGVVLFVSDARIKYLQAVLGPVPPIWVIAVVVGIIAGDLKGGVVGTLGAMVLGVGIIVVGAPVLFPEWFVTEVTTMGLVLGSMTEAVLNTVTWLFEDVTGIAALLAVVLVVFGVPMIYLFALVFGVIGGVIGRMIRKPSTDE